MFKDLVGRGAGTRSANQFDLWLCADVGARHKLEPEKYDMKTRNSILTACGLASAILAAGAPVLLAQDDYQLADPPADTTQKVRPTQQQAQQAQEDQQEWQQQRPQRMQQREARQQDRQEWQQQRRPQQQQMQQQMQQRMQQAQQPRYTRLIAAIHGVGDNENVKGTVQFDRESQGVRITAEIGGLQEEELYSIRIHQFGDLGSEDAQSVGESFSPGMDAQQQTIGTQQPRSQTANGAQETTVPQRGLGDLGSVRSDSDGNIRVEKTVTGFQLTSGESGILGRSVVVHRSDDGNRQNPVGVGVIGISKDGLSGAQTTTTTTGQADRAGENRDSD